MSLKNGVKILFFRLNQKIFFIFHRVSRNKNFSKKEKILFQKE